MKNHKLIIFTDCLLTLLLCLFSSLIILSSLKINFYFKISLCFIFSFCVCLIVLGVKLNKYKLLMIDQKDKKLLEKMLAELEIMPDNEVIALLFNFLKKNGIIGEKRSKYLKTENAVYLYNFDKVTERSFLSSAIKKHSNKKIYLFCNCLSPEANELYSSVKNKIHVYNGQETFALMKNCEFEYKAELNLKKDKFLKIKKFFSKAFTKKKAFGFFIIALLLFTFSNLTFFPLYYEISSFFLMVFSTLCFVFGKKENKYNLATLTLSESCE